MHCGICATGLSKHDYKHFEIASNSVLVWNRNEIPRVKIYLTAKVSTFHDNPSLELWLSIKRYYPLATSSVILNSKLVLNVSYLGLIIPVEHNSMSYSEIEIPYPLQWRHNKRNGVSNQRRLGCLLNRLFRSRLKKTSKLRVTGLCEGNPPVTGWFPSQRASNAENVSIWWRHHGPDMA